jgi:hypothetical protein
MKFRFPESVIKSVLTTPPVENDPMFLFGQLSMQDSFGNSRGRNLRSVIAIVCGYAGDAAGWIMLQDKLRSYDKSQFLRSPVRSRHRIFHHATVCGG